MAKLSAHGRTEVYRLAQTTGSTIRKHALMSDGKILESHSFLEYNGKRRSTGWTVFGTLKKGVKPETWFANRTAEGRWTQITR